MQLAEFAEFAVCGEPEGGGGEGEGCEREPEVFAEGGGDGFFAEVGELGEGGVVLCEVEGGELVRVGVVEGRGEWRGEGRGKGRGRYV